jgi:hypothetical protein
MPVLRKAISHQIVSSTSEGEDPIHSAHAAVTQLAHQRDRLQPAETFFDPLPLPLTDGVACVPRGAAINRAAAAALVVLRHMRPHPQMAAFFHEVARVEPFVAPTVTGFVPGIFSGIHSAASRSAVPLAWNTSVSTDGTRKLGNDLAGSNSVGVASERS